MATNDTTPAKGVQALLTALDSISPEASISETISDDYDLSAEVQQKILDTEGLLREALALFGIDYNALVRMDAQSAYAQAIQASPEVARRVAEASNPVLEALKVAVYFQPYAEFQSKYGQTPEEIKANLRKEFEQELASGEVANENKAAAVKVEAPLFSRTGRPASQGTTARSNALTGDLRAFIKR